jgi:hypothetical protein
MIAAIAVAASVTLAPPPEQQEIHKVTREVCKRARTATLIISRDCLEFVRSYIVVQISLGRPEAISQLLDGDTHEAKAIMQRAREIGQ